MRQIVDRILQEEQSARLEVERAQTQSKDMVLKAKEEAACLIQEAVNKAEALARNKKEEARKDFLAEKDKILKKAKDDAALLRSKRSEDIPKISGVIFSKIITIKG